MRTTLTIDDDLLNAAKQLAHEQSASVGQILSDLARRGLATTMRQDSRNDTGFPVFQVPTDAAAITLDDVRKIEDEV